MRTLRTLLYAATAAFLATSLASPSHASSLDWETLGWNPADVSGSQSFMNVDGSGVDVTVDYSTFMWDGTPDVYGPDPDFALPPDVLGSLRFTNDMDPTGGIQPTNVTITFSEEVFIDAASLVSLSIIWDRWQEHGVVEAFDGMGAPVAASSYTTTDAAEVLLDMDGDANYETIGALFQDDGRYGDALFSWTQVPVKSLSFSLFVTNVGMDRPVVGFASAGVGDVEFRAAVPEPAVLGLLGAGLGGLLVMGRPRVRR